MTVVRIVTWQRKSEKIPDISPWSITVDAAKDTGEREQNFRAVLVRGQAVDDVIFERGAVVRIVQCVEGAAVEGAHAVDRAFALRAKEWTG